MTASIGAQFRPSKILIVEDESPIARLLSRALTKEGYVVSVAQSAEEALDGIGEIAPDAILLDVGLPGMSGLEFLRHLRSAERWRDLVVIVLSGQWFNIDDPELVHATAQCSKPIAPSKLIRTLQELGIPPMLPGAAK